MKNWFILMRNAFSLKFLVFILIVQCCVKGLTFAIFSNGIFPLLKSMGIDATQIQLYSALALSPWTVKPLFGLFSDLVAFGGFHKRYLMFFACLVGLAGSIVMVIDLRIPILVVCMILMIHFEIAVCDLLTEGMYAELMRKNPHTGSSIVNYAQFCQQIGFVIATSFIGPLDDMGLFRVNNIIGLVMALTPIPFLIGGWLPEKKRENNPPVILVDTFRLRKQWRIVLVVALTGISAPAMAAVAALASKWLGLFCSIGILCLVSAGGFWAFDEPIIGRVVLYQILTQASRISFSSALDFFFTADAACLPEGPQFSLKFYITIAGIVSSLAALLTTLIYEFLFSKWNYRSVLLFTSILSGVSGIFDFIIVRRWNVALGIPDYIAFLFGDDIIHSICDMLFWIPASSIIGKVCPENMEVCTYSFIAGASNYAYMVAAMIGAILSELWGIATIGDCNWEGLDKLVLGGHVIAILVVSIPASFLIPNVPQDSDMICKKVVEQPGVLVKSDDIPMMVEESDFD